MICGKLAIPFFLLRFRGCFTKRREEDNLFTFLFTFAQHSVFDSFAFLFTSIQSFTRLYLKLSNDPLTKQTTTCYFCMIRFLLLISSFIKTERLTKIMELKTLLTLTCFYVFTDDLFMFYLSLLRVYGMELLMERMNNNTSILQLSPFSFFAS